MIEAAWLKPAAWAPWRPDQAQLDAFEAELFDRFGALPPAAEKLVMAARIAILARRARIGRIDAGPAAIALTPHDESAALPDSLGLVPKDGRWFLKERPTMTRALRGSWLSSKRSLLARKDYLGAGISIILPGRASLRWPSEPPMIYPSRHQTAFDVAEHYDELDPVYRSVWGEHVHHGYWRTGAETPEQATEALTALVAERLELRAGDTVCDIGCGYGASAEYIAGRFDARVVGLSLSGAQVALARERVPPAGALQFHQRDWIANDLPTGDFDGAYAIESSEHMADKDRFFAEVARVLRPGGRLVVCAWLASSRPGPRAVRYLLEPICREGRLPSMGTREDYEAMAGKAGLRLEGFEDISANVRRTWAICARRIMGRLATDRQLRRMVLDRQVRNRAFLLSVPRLMVALRMGAMRYGVFVWTKPGSH